VACTASRHSVPFLFAFLGASALQQRYSVALLLLLGHPQHHPQQHAAIHILNKAIHRM
jgi:hypothetical protein